MNLTSLHSCCPWERFIQLLCKRNSVSVIDTAISTLDSEVVFFILIKRAKDQLNHPWIAEATENSTYFLSFDSSIFLHLKNAASSTQSWPRSLPW
ncbi:protein BREAST CANCER SUSCEPTIBILITY [Populus alba x Populus x berolinensis]|nr:protein BREAST CANCER SUSCEPTIBILITY [Populus alba x Populus x berolinensis]